MQLPQQLGTNYVIRLSKVYSILYNNKYGMKPRVNFGQTGKVFKELIEDFNEYQISYLLVLFFEWKGANGDDEFTKKRLENCTHNIFTLQREVNPMLVYIKNVLKVDIDNIKEIEPVINSLVTNK